MLSAEKTEQFLYKYRFLAFFLLLGIILILLGVYFGKKENNSAIKVEVLNETTESAIDSREIVVEIAGRVEKPGVYKLTGSSRIEDLLITAGGLSSDADRLWVEKYLNRAQKLIDGQKIYIPAVGEQTNQPSAKNGEDYQTVSPDFGGERGVLVNINNAGLTELDTLPGIGPVYGQNIIDHRPYSKIDELLSKGVLKTSVYEKIKSFISVY